MRSRLTPILTVIGAVTVLVLAGNTVAMAANGHGFLLGQSNSATKVTTLNRTTAGAALGVHTKSSTDAPLTVNGSGRVTHLNADKVDGADAATLRTHSYVFTRTIPVDQGVDQLTMALPVPAGSYLVDYSAFLINATGNTWCQVQQSAPATGKLNVGTSQFTVGASTPGLTGSGVVTKTSDGSLTLLCGSGHAFSANGTSPIQVVLTPTTLVGG